VDKLVDAASAAEALAWRAQLMQAAAVRELKKAASGRADGFVAWCEVADLVVRECRSRFDADQSDVGRALDKLCAEGVIRRRQQVREAKHPWLIRC
jgi:DNA-binding MarR family transcriptional regulator